MIVPINNPLFYVLCLLQYELWNVLKKDKNVNSDYPRTLANRGTNLKIECFVLNLNRA